MAYDLIHYQLSNTWAGLIKFWSLHLSDNKTSFTDNCMIFKSISNTLDIACLHLWDKFLKFRLFLTFRDSSSKTLVCFPWFWILPYSLTQYFEKRWVVQKLFKILIAYFREGVKNIQRGESKFLNGVQTFPLLLWGGIQISASILRVGIDGFIIF